MIPSFLIKRTREFLVMAGLLALLAACAGKEHRPAVTTPTPPEHWTALPGQDSQLPPDWLAEFDDESLTAAVGEALAHNRELRAAAARLDQAQALSRIAGAGLLPQVSAGANGRRQQSTFFGLPLPGAKQGVFAVKTTSYGTSLDVSWEADLWGRLRAGKRAALADVAASQATVAGARLSLAGQTAKAWFAAAEARKQEALARKTVENYTRTLKSTKRRYRAGLVTFLDLRLSRANQASAEALLATRQQQRDETLRQLEILLGRYPGGNMEAGVELPDPPGPIPAGLPANLVSRRPDLIAAEWRLAAAGARLSQSRAARYPRLSLTASGGTASPDLHHILDPDFKVWSLAAGILAPIFQGGRLKAGVHLDQARVEEAAESFAQALLAAYGEVESHLFAEQQLTVRERQLSIAAREAAAAEKLAENRYREGLVDIFGLLESQRRRLRAEGDWIAVRRLLLTNRIDLYLALGGGFHTPPHGTEARGGSRS